MPHSSDWQVYGPLFVQLLEAAVAREIVIQRDSEAEAIALKGRLYAFHGAIKRAASAKSPDPEALRLNLLRMRVRYKQTGATVLAGPSGLDAQDRSIMAALGSVQSSSDLPSAGFLAGLEGETK